jgi:hypothetical protein
MSTIDSTIEKNLLPKTIVVAIEKFWSSDQKNFDHCP